MHWEPCEICKEKIIIFDLKRTPTGFRCEPPCRQIKPPPPVRPEGPGPTRPVVPPPPPTEVRGKFQYAAQLDEAIFDEEMDPPHGTLLNKEESQAIWSIILKSRGPGPFDPEGDRLIRALFRVTGNDRPNWGGDAFPDSAVLPKAKARRVNTAKQVRDAKLQDDFGFTEPEDGSERRFIFSQVKQGVKPPWMKQSVVPWARYRFWWLLHNAIAHPLIAIMPRRTFFRFHDYTSRRMHGK